MTVAPEIEAVRTAEDQNLRIQFCLAGRQRFEPTWRPLATGGGSPNLLLRVAIDGFPQYFVRAHALFGNRIGCPLSLAFARFAILFGILEAPPGFEPGMEVLQIS